MYHLDLYTSVLYKNYAFYVQFLIHTYLGTTQVFQIYQIIRYNLEMFSLIRMFCSYYLFNRTSTCIYYFFKDIRINIYKTYLKQAFYYKNNICITWQPTIKGNFYHLNN